jgi:hypothetical protein
MLNFLLLLSAAVGLTCGWITAHLTHDSTLSAVVAVVVTLLSLFGLAGLLIKAAGAACDPPREQSHGQR